MLIYYHFLDYMCLDCIEQTIFPGAEKAPEKNAASPGRKLRVVPEYASARSGSMWSGTRRMAPTVGPGLSKKGSTARQGSGTVSSTHPVPRASSVRLPRPRRRTCIEAS